MFSIDYAPILLDEDSELFQAIVSNDDNLNYGSIISVYIEPDEFRSSASLMSSLFGARLVRRRRKASGHIAPQYRHR
ncbi:hypothetical protein [Sinorhizobium meliloti]|uniref:hypothetical protein n=1 Tax=Rhizobium meliloti TaxID=382 RepID=UPI00238075E1|nr:hypothetical protein [Sinorhizobium meliloti]MDE3819709.1 hypothetical protein [Sinorhizobium meliloti]